MSFIKRLFGGGKAAAPVEPDPTEWPLIENADFDALLEAEKGSVDGWTVVKNEKNIKVWKNTTAGSIYPVRAIFTLPNITSDVAYQLMHNHELRTEWDKFYQEYSILGKVNEVNEYLYQAMKGPPGVQGRDFVLYRGVRIDPQNSVYLLVFKNAANDQRPVNSTYVRARCIRSGYVIRPLPDDPKSCQMFVFSHNDVRGSLPKWLINIVAPRGVVQWYNNFRKACEMLRDKLEALVAAGAGGVAAAAAVAAAEAAAPAGDVGLSAHVHLDAKFDALDLSADPDAIAAEGAEEDDGS